MNILQEILNIQHIMNSIECFSRSRSAKNCRPFFVFAPVLVSQLASCKEYCHGCTFAPVWCPRWHQARSIATDAHLRPSGVPVGIRQGVLPRMHICARSGVPVGIRQEVLPRMHICARLVSPLASGKEYCHGCTFAPVWCPVGIRQGVLPRMHICARLVSRWHQARSIATAAHLRPFWCPRWYQARSIATAAHLRPFRVSIPSYYTHYSKSRELEFLQWCPLLAARYRLYRVSQILGNCKQI